MPRHALLITANRQVFGVSSRPERDGTVNKDATAKAHENYLTGTSGIAKRQNARNRYTPIHA
jgi:hypothetical protein